MCASSPWRVSDAKKGGEYHEASDGRDLEQINIKHPAPHLKCRRSGGDSRGLGRGIAATYAHNDRRRIVNYTERVHVRTHTNARIKLREYTCECVRTQITGYPVMVGS